MEAIQQKQKPFIVGVTGGIGCGKTTVTNLFAAKGIDIIDADVVAREVVMPNTEGLRALVAHFGKHIVNEQGELDRAALRDLIFANPQAKDVVNKTLHPLIRVNMMNQLADAQSQYCILSAPLLFENKLQSLVNLCLVIDIPENMQLERTLSRDGGNADTIKRIIQSQVTREERLALADDIIDNSQSLEALAPQVDALHRKYCALASK